MTHTGEASAFPADVSPAVAARICDAFGLFGSPDECAERLMPFGHTIGRRLAEVA